MSESTRGGVVVTGASSGIGEATAVRLARAGFRVFGGYRREEDGQRLAETGVTPVRLDVTDPASVRIARDEVLGALAGDSLVGLVNNAGVPGAGPVETLSIEVYRRVLEVNVLGVLAVTQAFLPALRATRGRIVMMSSVSGRVSMPFMSPYSASKYALEAISDSLRRELLPEGVDVIVLEPGPIVTPIWNSVEELDLEVYRGTPYEGPIARLREQALEGGRTGLPADAVARAVERALTAARPKSRSLIVARFGKLRIRLLAWLPDRLVDRMIVRNL